MKRALYIVIGACLAIIAAGYAAFIFMLRKDDARPDAAAFVSGVPPALEGTWLDATKNGLWFRGDGTAVSFWEGFGREYDALKNKWAITDTCRVESSGDWLHLQAEKDDWHWVFRVNEDTLQLGFRANGMFCSQRELRRIGGPGDLQELYTEDDIPRARDSLFADVDARRLYELARSDKLERVPAPYIRGKVLAIKLSKDEPWVDSVVCTAEMHSRREAEIGTILFYEPSHRSVGWYKNGADARQLHVNVHIVDRMTKRLILSESLHGTPPPDWTSSTKWAAGSDPMDDVKKKVEGLKRLDLDAPE